MGKFVISTRSNGEYQFNLKADNGQVILSSEGYTTKAGCENGIESVKKILKTAPILNALLPKTVSTILT